MEGKMEVLEISFDQFYNLLLWINAHVETDSEIFLFVFLHVIHRC